MFFRGLSWACVSICLNEGSGGAAAENADFPSPCLAPFFLGSSPSASGYFQFRGTCLNVVKAALLISLEQSLPQSSPPSAETNSYVTHQWLARHPHRFENEKEKGGRERKRD